VSAPDPKREMRSIELKLFACLVALILLSLLQVVVDAHMRKWLLAATNAATLLLELVAGFFFARHLWPEEKPPIKPRRPDGTETYRSER
jgi:hypothetical protein